MDISYKKLLYYAKTTKSRMSALGQTAPAEEKFIETHNQINDKCKTESTDVNNFANKLLIALGVVTAVGIAADYVINSNPISAISTGLVLGGSSLASNLGSRAIFAYLQHKDKLKAQEISRQEYLETLDNTHSELSR